jgi:hypothetical protein
MAKLKPGSVDDMAGSMAEMIDQAMEAEYPLAFDGKTLSDQGKRDRQVLFVAVAKGVLGYLQANLASLQTNVVKDDPVKGHSHQLQFDLE